MKKFFIITFIIINAVSNISAQENYFRKKYRNFSFSTMEMKQDIFPTLKSNYGAALTIGRTFFVHKKPIAGIIRFGIDATWFDMNYTNYKIEFRNNDASETLNYHEVELGMQIGPSITVNPISKLSIQGYFRYAPSFSGLYRDETFLGNYATFFVGGGTISYGVIGLGIEARYGNCKYNEYLGGDEDEEDASSTSTKYKTTFSGMRAYISLRF